MNILSNESCIGEIVRFLNFRVPNPWVRLVRPKIIAQEIYNVKNVYRLAHQFCGGASPIKTYEKKEGG